MGQQIVTGTEVDDQMTVESYTPNHERRLGVAFDHREGRIFRYFLGLAIILLMFTMKE